MYVYEPFSLLSQLFYSFDRLSIGVNLKKIVPALMYPASIVFHYYAAITAVETHLSMFFVVCAF
jgi:hypothetical protein